MQCASQNWQPLKSPGLSTSTSSCCPNKRLCQDCIGIAAASGHYTSTSVHGRHPWHPQAVKPISQAAHALGLDHQIQSSFEGPALPHCHIWKLKEKNTTNPKYGVPFLTQNISYINILKCIRINIKHSQGKLRDISAFQPPKPCSPFSHLGSCVTAIIVELLLRHWTI